MVTLSQMIIVAFFFVVEVGFSCIDTVVATMKNYGYTVAWAV